MLELIHPDDAERATEAWNEVASGTDVDAVTIRLRRAAGGYAWFEVNGSSVRTDDGEARFMLGTARDVSEREELRSRLRDLDAVYRFADAVAGARALDEVLEAALDALLEATGADRASVLLADDEGVCASARWRGLSDRYRAATEGRSPWPADAEDPQPVLVEDLAGAGFEPALERAVRKEGIGALAFVPLVRGGRLLGKFMLYRDAPHVWSDRELLLSRTIANHLASVTERTAAQQALHESREQLASMLRTVEEGITATNREGRFLFANDAAARRSVSTRRTGWSRSRPGAAARFEIFDPDGAPVAPEDLPSAMALTGTESSAVVRVRSRADDWERWLALRSTPVLSPGRRGGARRQRHTRHHAGNARRSARGDARHEAEASRARLALLLEATEQLSQTLDYEELLRRVPQLVVPRIADGCHVYIARGETRARPRRARARRARASRRSSTRSTTCTTSRATGASRSSRPSALASRFTGRR